MKLSRLLFVCLLIPLLAMLGCTGDTGPIGPQGPAGDQGPAGNSTCSDCHNDTNLISGKLNQWKDTLHGSGEAYLRGTSASCAGCHSGHAFMQRIEAGLQPDEVTEGDPEPTRQDCRACHMIHDTYTSADWAVRGTNAVPLFAITGATFDGGLGNLCVNCHQPRRDFPEPVNGDITGISSHWGPHHGPQSAMILGRAGAGVSDMPNVFHMNVPDTCVHCHMGDGREHYFEPAVSSCNVSGCHSNLTNFDYHRVQTVVDSMTTVLGDLLLQNNLIDQNNEDGHPTVTSAPLNQAVALWNWIYVAHEDKSHGVHNSNYAKALLQAGIDSLSTPVP